MTPEQVAAAQLDLSKLQVWITAIAIVVGPLAGVLFTFWFQARKDRQAAKHDVFMTLMGQRKSFPASPELLKALNTIDVVFSKEKHIVELWHKYYALLGQDPSEERNHTWLELLEAIAESLGYPKLKQTDLDKFYIPKSAVDQLEISRAINTELLRVLKASGRLQVEARPPSNDPTER